MVDDSGEQLTRSNWCDVRRIIVRRYKIEGEKIGMK